MMNMLPKLWASYHELRAMFLSTLHPSTVHGEQEGRAIFAHSND